MVVYNPIDPTNKNIRLINGPGSVTPPAKTLPKPQDKRYRGPGKTLPKKPPIASLPPHVLSKAAQLKLRAK